VHQLAQQHQQMAQQLQQQQHDTAAAFQQLSAALAQMATGIGAIANARPPINVTTQSLEKPEKYKGKIGPDARRFLTTFTVWAFSTGGQLNRQNAQGHYERIDESWIRVALTFLQGEAAIWAQPYLEEVMGAASAPPTAVFPFGGNWDTFRKAFLKRWDSPAEKQEAIEALHMLQMDRDTAAQYTTKFKEIAQRTGFGPDDLHYRYRLGLTTKLKDALAVTDKPQSNFEELAQTACEIDQRMRANRAEQAMKDGKPLPRGYNSIIDAYSKKASSTDPDAMDVDAINIMASILNPEQRKKWAVLMKDRCYACTSNRHQSKDCPVKKDKYKCEHCTLAGHNKQACLRRFAGHPAGPPARRAAVARLEEVDSDHEPEFFDPADAASGAADVEPLVSIDATTTAGNKKKRTRAKKAVSNPGAKASDAASVASTSSLPPKPTVNSLFGSGSTSLAPGPWATTIETREAARVERKARKAELEKQMAALRHELAGAESDEDDGSDF
jgi:hypothetical protein